jgi:hypothetical protein
MVVPQKPMLVIILFSLIISCGNIAGEQQKSTQKNKVYPSSKDKKSELPSTKKELLKPSETPSKKKEEKKKFRKLDTLKPVVVIP